ncbi:MAG TPA: GNAT family N-acetyltransferase [Terracidiphilus sp.]|jgi:amino-acid N-acetyltransferase
MLVRKARLQDASHVYDLVNSLSHDGTLLKRSFAEICENIRDFTVALSDAGVFLGCGALHFYGPHLCEVRSIVVKPEARANGAGGRILGSLIDEAEEHGIQSVCLFTRIPDFFFKYGFRVVEDKTELPDKIFKDCQSCPRLHRCDEVAMVRGRIPRVSILGPRIEAEQLVRIGGQLEASTGNQFSQKASYPSVAVVACSVVAYLRAPD